MLKYPKMKILIATLYQPYSILTICNKFAIDSVIALIDENPDKTMTESIRILEESLGKVLLFKTQITDLYNIISVAKDVVSIIDEIPENDEIYIDVTSGRKPKSFGLVYGSYARAKRIKQITYVQEENNQPILLPKMVYPIHDTQMKMLQIIKDNKVITTGKLAKQMEFSRGLIYRYINEFLEMNIIIKEADLVRLTDYGEIVLL
jgi:CRISPR-associated protein Csa3